jgi:signal transduction histidine kinase
MGELIHKTILPLLKTSPDYTVQILGTEDCPKVLGDRVRLTQVIKNLLSNAIKYSPHNRTIIIQANVQEEALRISISDQGIGMTSEQQKHLFERFYRATTSTINSNGTGLGLAICKLLIELHGGKIWIESEYGVGTIVYFTLPLASS